MPKRPNPAMVDDQNPEWTEQDIAGARKLSDLPEEHQRVLKALMGENAAAKKVPVPLSPEVVDKMQATGEGWEKRMEEAVRLWLERHAKRRKMAS